MDELTIDIAGAAVDVVSLLYALGLIGGIAVYFWKLEPRLRALEAAMKNLDSDLTTQRAQHTERIDKNEAQIAELKNMMGRIDERTGNTDRNVTRLLDRVDGIGTQAGQS